MTESPDGPRRTKREKLYFALAKAAAIFLLGSGALVTQQTVQHEGDRAHLIAAIIATIASLGLAIVIFRHDAQRKKEIRHASRSTR